jgi:hypothetical protein
VKKIHPKNDITVFTNCLQYLLLEACWHKGTSTLFKSEYHILTPKRAISSKNIFPMILCLIGSRVKGPTTTRQHKSEDPEWPYAL